MRSISSMSSRDIYHKYRALRFQMVRNPSRMSGPDYPHLPQRTIPLPLVLAVCAAIVGLWLALGMPLSSGCGPQALPWIVDAGCGR